jgi:ribose transport system permease protein
VGAVYALAGVVAAELAQHMAPAPAIIIGILCGFVVGAVNGIVATYLRINALIATLAMSFVISGIGSLITHGNLVVLFNHQGFGKLARTEFITVKTSIWIMLIAVVVLGLFLARTTLGRYMYAAGGNAEAARIAGVHVNRTRVVSFMLSGGAAGLAGVIDASRVLSAQSASGSGDALTFTVLAGIVVGGTSILGGEGAVWRTVVGVLFIALIGNGYDLLGLNPLYEQITLGVIMLLAVGIDAWARQRRS